MGEVVISYPQSIRQASDRGVNVWEEISLLIVHGVLHLFGHDHTTNEEAKEMKAKENAALVAMRSLEEAQL